MLTKRRMKNKISVTFTLPAEEGDESVQLVGDFNEWDVRATPMTLTREGSWEVKLGLKPNREYQYRYLVNGSVWRNDCAADSYVRNQSGSENSVLTTIIQSSKKRARSTETASSMPGQKLPYENG